MEWVGWIGICGTFLGATTVVQVVIGHMGRVLFSRAILHMYVLSFVVTWCAMIGTGIICVPYYYQVWLVHPLPIAGYICLGALTGVFVKY